MQCDIELKSCEREVDVEIIFEDDVGYIVKLHSDVDSPIPLQLPSLPHHGPYHESIKSNAAFYQLSTKRDCLETFATKQKVALKLDFMNDRAPRNKLAEKAN